MLAAQADLVAQWMLVGFVHGVMNTDNMTISGETIDYGPCAFLDGYDPRAVFSSIDHQGRYAYGNQPRIAAWNLARLAEAILPLLADDEGAAVAAAEGALSTFTPRFEEAYRAAMGEKIGLTLASDDDALVGEVKRLYVVPHARGAHAGRALMQALLERARALRYGTLKLDTLATMTSARALYASLGFRECAAYYRNPLPGVAYMSLRL